MEIQIPISIGELVDKITILEIKIEKVNNKIKKINIENELTELTKIFNDLSNTELDPLYRKLKIINKKLWDIEDEIRVHEKNKNFNDEFIELARSVYVTNDERFEIKSKINNLYDSDIVEEKLYEEY
tara:strand:- start:1324 stop:1704 length:381 start_codon:yes stop_codon:yes gene_type:complete